MRIHAMMQRVFKEMLRDKRTLALMFLAPLLILSLVYFLFSANGKTTATIAVRNVDSSLITAMKNKHLKIDKVSSETAAAKVVRDKDIAGMLTQSGSKLTLTLANSDQSQSAVLKQALAQAQIKLKVKAAGTALKTQSQALKKLAAALAEATHNPQAASAAAGKGPKAAASYKVKTHYLYGSSKSTFFDTLLPILMGFVVFFFVFLISGIALLRERTTGTLYRLLATPVRRFEIIAGYLIGYGTFAAVQTVLIVLFTLYVFKIQILGNVAWVLLVNLLLAAVALTMGLFVSTFTTSEFQMMQFIPIVAIPQIFFSGIIPVATMPGWLQAIAHLMPLYYGANAMSAVVEKGQSFGAIWLDLLILLVFAGGFLTLNLMAMRRYRRV